ncbi:hypothetical protein N0V90_008597 [Kalmusia sp. IMI 367209]|nr:hypothetical protein N0V90_008597 [Kalmusia sp. IMI 367209]
MSNELSPIHQLARRCNLEAELRYASWYTPWTWGRSSTPSELASDHTTVPEPVVTTATPELQPAGVDQPAATANTAQNVEAKSVEELLSLDPTASVDSNAFVDPITPITYWGNLKDLGLDYGWGPSAFFESLVELTYINTELGWAGAILASALILRTGLFFMFQRPGSDAMAKTAALRPALQPMMDELEQAKRMGDDDRVQALKLKQQGIMKEFGGPMGKSLGAGVAQAVFGFGAFRSLRGMSTLPVPGMSTEGLAWFTDLTVHDPYYVLPLVTGGIMYSIMRMGGETGLATEASTTSLQKNAQVVLPILMTAVTAFQPAALQLYFFCSATTGGITAYALRQPAFRRFIGIRPLPTPESNKLYSKAVRGEIPLSALKGPDGKVRYQAPTTRSASTSSRTLSSGINLKRGATLPPHIQQEAKEETTSQMPEGSVGKKWEWVKDNYRPKKLGEKMGKMVDQRDPEVKRKQEKRAEQKRAAERYEEERKRRFDSGR